MSCECPPAPRPPRCRQLWALVVAWFPELCASPWVAGLRWEGPREGPVWLMFLSTHQPGAWGCPPGFELMSFAVWRSFFCVQQEATGTGMSLCAVDIDRSRGMVALSRAVGLALAVLADAPQVWGVTCPCLLCRPSLEQTVRGSLCSMTSWVQNLRVCERDSSAQPGLGQRDTGLPAVPAQGLCLLPPALALPVPEQHRGEGTCFHLDLGEILGPFGTAALMNGSWKIGSSRKGEMQTGPHTHHP